MGGKKEKQKQTPYGIQSKPDTCLPKGIPGSAVFLLTREWRESCFTLLAHWPLATDLGLRLRANLQLFGKGHVNQFVLLKQEEKIP